MIDPKNKPESKLPSVEIVVRAEQKPCGCLVEELATKEVRLSPCQPCGLVHTGQALHAVANAAIGMAQALQQAGSALMATGRRLAQERKNAL